MKVAILITTVFIATFATNGRVREGEAKTVILAILLGLAAGGIGTAFGGPNLGLIAEGMIINMVIGSPLEKIRSTLSSFSERRTRIRTLS